MPRASGTKSSKGFWGHQEAGEGIEKAGAHENPGSSLLLGLLEEAP